MPPLSVIICTHNPRADYLQFTLNALRGQTLPLDQWELLLIDNGSTEPLAQSWDISWHPGARHVREDVLGLTPARLRGIKEASGELLVFVDDDNALDARYLEVARDLARQWPQVGAFGGSQVAAFEQAPAPDTKDYLGWLALRTIPRVTWTNIKGLLEATPLGAGLCVRRHLALEYGHAIEKSSLRRLLDRSGATGLLSAGDLDLAWSVCDFGYGTLVTPELVLTHHISKGRVDKAYLLRLIEYTKASEVIVNKIHHVAQPKPHPIRARLHILLHKRGFARQVAFALERGQAMGLRLVREKSE